MAYIRSTSDYHYNLALKAAKQREEMEKKFVQGIKTFKPRDNAPAFIKAQLVISKKDLAHWLRDQEGEEIRVDMKESQKGTFYLEVNTFQPNGAASRSVADTDDSLPF